MFDLILIVLPAFSIFIIGYIGQKKIGFDRKSISTMALYLMQPFLAFRTFYTNEITLEYLYIILFCVLLCFILIQIVHIVAKFSHASQSTKSAMVLSGVFMNAGNYGVPIILFAFGSSAVDYAVIMMVIQNFLMNSVGVFYAAKGSEQGKSLKESLFAIVKMPMIYGALLGVFLQLTSISVADLIMQPVGLIADATIPTIMLVLGMQLATIERKKVNVEDVSIVFVIRMVISPIVALFLIWILPIDELLAQTLMVLSAMPAAANTMMLSLRFNTGPDLVSYSTLVTTLFSIISVPIMLMLVM